jgi:hypothetical protein
LHDEIAEPLRAGDDGLRLDEDEFYDEQPKKQSFFRRIFG